MHDPRSVVTVKTRRMDGAYHVLTFDTPRGAWRLDELHEVAREAADALGMLTDETIRVDVRVTTPRPW